MTPRPIHRWKSFWLGLIALASIGWAWHSSIDTRTSILSKTPAGLITLAHYEGEVGLFYDSGRAGDWEYHVFHWENIRRIPHSEAAWRADKNDRGIIVGHYGWLLILFAIPWLAFLIWRWRHMRVLREFELAP